MPVRAIQARLECSPQVLQALWRTHVAFNERLPKILGILFQMKRGECGETDAERDLYRRIAEFILARPAREATYLLNSVSIPNWKPNTAKKMKVEIIGPSAQRQTCSGDTWADEAAALSQEGKLLYDKYSVLGDVPDLLRQIIVRECVAIVSSHQELLKRWASEHDAWLQRKAAWEAQPEHSLYLALRPQFDVFERSVGGKPGERRERWPVYLNWLRANPQFAAWRGAAAQVTELSERANLRIARAKPWRARSIEVEEFWKANPELAALDKLHNYYEREFIRRRKTKKNPDGFHHRPTFTLPDAVRHPRWFSFNAPQSAPQGYRDLVLPAASGDYGSLKLRLLSGKTFGGEFSAEWVPVRFKSDPRFADFRRVAVRRIIRRGKDKGHEKEADAFCLLDRQLNLERQAKISGAKLMFRHVKLDSKGRLFSADPYLVFACDISAIPLSDGAKALQWVDGGENRKRVVIPVGLTTCAVDLGIRNVGFATIAVKDEEEIRILRSRNIWIGHEEEKGRHRGRWSPGPDLGHIASHKRDLSLLRRLRGRPVHGEESHTELRGHITDMAEDRFKKAARKIVNFAVNTEGTTCRTNALPFPRADVLIVGELAPLLPDAEREHGINRSLLDFTRGHLVDRIRQTAADCGLRVFEISPIGASQVCSRCGTLGRRYSIRKNEAGAPDIIFGPVEKLFACPGCGYNANSDHNASVNLHRRFVHGESAVKAFRDWQSLSTKRRAERNVEIEQALLLPLRRLHRMQGAMLPE